MVWTQSVLFSGKIMVLCWLEHILKRPQDRSVNSFTETITVLFKSTVLGRYHSKQFEWTHDSDGRTGKHFIWNRERTESTESYGKCNTENTAHVFYFQWTKCPCRFWCTGRKLFDLTEAVGHHSEDILMEKYPLRLGWWQHMQQRMMGEDGCLSAILKYFYIIFI